MNNIILAVGDSGSAVNFIRNLITLSDRVHWPHNELPRLDCIINCAYPDSLRNNLNNWMQCEYKLRNWEKAYDIDVSHEPNKSILTDKVHESLTQGHVAFMVHWIRYAEHIVKEINTKVITISPATEFGLRWQIRSFVEKCGIDNVPNYTFTDNVEEQRCTMINLQGIDYYRRLNVLNMYEIIKNRIVDYQDFGNTNGICVYLEELFSEQSFKLVVEKINNYFDIDIDIDTAMIVYKAWWQLHWPVEHTKDFIWLNYE